MARHSITGKLGVALVTPSTTGPNADLTLGGCVDADNGARYRLVEASSAIAQYAAVKIDNDWTAVEITTAISGDEPTKIGVAQNAIASGERGYVVTRGPGSVLAAASAAADVKVGTTTTAGVIDDTYGDLISGMTLTATNGGSQAATAFFATKEMETNGQD